MSKIGRLPLTLPAGTTITQSGSSIVVKGSKGELSYTMPSSISLTVDGDKYVVTRASDSKDVRALHGLVRALIANMIVGVSTGFTKTLELQGTGYRARNNGNNIVLSLGFSHEIDFPAPAGITLKVENNLITISGIDRQAVGQVAAQIRAYKPPEPYKGKGIRYVGEVVRRKAGKAAKAAAA